MASRSSVDERRKAMEDALRHACRSGTLAPGTALPPLRSIAEEYGLSRQIAWRGIQNLTAEGLLTTAPRQGTFVSRPSREAPLYLVLFPHVSGWTRYLQQGQDGFEERISQLGGASLCLVEKEAQEWFAAGNMPALAGIFRLYATAPAREENLWWPRETPAVVFGPTSESAVAPDSVQFDDEGGARLATQHLLAMGHKGIAFVALHTEGGSPPDYFWSRQREKGWRQAMEAAGLPCASLALHPEPRKGQLEDGSLSGEQQFQAAEELARSAVLPRREISALVVANVTAAEGVFAALASSGRPPGAWPAVICFDSSTSKARQVMSHIRLPWEEVGRRAADALWARSTGRTAGGPRTLLVPMTLIQRISCRPGNLHALNAPLLLSPGRALEAVA